MGMKDTFERSLLTYIQQDVDQLAEAIESYALSGQIGGDDCEGGYCTCYAMPTIVIAYKKGATFPRYEYTGSLEGFLELLDLAAAVAAEEVGK